MDLLTDNQLKNLSQAKVDTRIGNEKYLRAHPELAQLIRTFVHHVVQEKPTDLATYTHTFFAREVDEIQNDMEQNAKFH